MDRSDDEEQGLAPAAAFELVGHEIRAEIVRVLGDARDERSHPAVLSFSELRSEIDVDVGSSKFNYHLGQLVGEFVERRDDGYRLRHAGTTLYRTIRARAHAEGADMGPYDTGLECYHCGSAMEASLTDWGYALACPDCEYVYDWTLVPPGAATAAGDELRARLDEYVRHRRRAFVRGVCPICANGLETRLIDPSEAEYPRPDLRSVVVNRYCDHCTNLRYLTVGEVLRLRPVVADFFSDRGTDVRATPLWELPFAVTDRSTTVRSTDPWEVELAVDCDGDTLTVLADSDLSVVDSRID